MRLPRNLLKQDRWLQNRLFRFGRRCVRRLLSVAPSPVLGNAEPTRRFFIFGDGRTGSTLLVDLLDSSPAFQCDGEILNRWYWKPRSVIATHLRHATTPVYGFKLLSYQVDLVQSFPQPRRFLQWLISSGFRMIYLERENLLRHALSQINARHRCFHERGNGGGGSRPLHVERDELFWWLEKMPIRKARDRRTVAGLDYVDLVYERDLEDAAQWSTTIQRICDTLSVPAFEPATTLNKVTARRLSDLVANYDEVCRMLRGTPHERWLE